MTIMNELKAMDEVKALNKRHMDDWKEKNETTTAEVGGVKIKTEEIKIDRIREELEYESKTWNEYYQSGFDKDALRHWYTMKGIQKALDILGYDTECDTNTWSWTITKR